MSILLKLVSILLLAATVIAPVVVLVRVRGVFNSIFVASVVCISLSIALAWWVDISPAIQLLWMGYDFDGMSESDRLLSVPSELHQQATQLYLSRMGIGWPLKAMLGIFFFGFPYLLFVITIKVAVTTVRTRRKIRNKELLSDASSYRYAAPQSSALNASNS